MSMTMSIHQIVTSLLTTRYTLQTKVICSWEDRQYFISMWVHSAQRQMASFDAFRPRHFSELLWNRFYFQWRHLVSAQWPFVTAVRLSRNWFGLVALVGPWDLVALAALVGLLVIVLHLAMLYLSVLWIMKYNQIANGQYKDDLFGQMIIFWLFYLIQNHFQNEARSLIAKFPNPLPKAIGLGNLAG